jgi:AI-2 transport protein TqsA
MELGRGAKTVLMLAAVVVVMAGIKLSAPLLVPLLLAAFVAMVTSPLVIWLQKKRLPAGVAVLLAILVDLGVLTGLGALVGTSLSDFYQRLPEYQEALTSTLADATTWLAAYGVSQEELTKALDPGSMMGMVASLFRSLTDLVSNLVLVLLIVMFILLETTGLRLKASLILGDDGAQLTRMRNATHQVSRYLVVKTLTSAFTALVVGIWLAIWGVHFPVLWALLAFMLNFIPTLGSIIAAVPPTALALIQFGPGSALGMLTGYVVINTLIGTVMEPRIFGRAVGLSPLVVFVSMILWGWLLGPVGALLSVPLTLIVKIYLANTEDLQWVAVLLAPARHIEDGRESLIPPPLVDHHANLRPSQIPPPGPTGAEGDGATVAGEPEQAAE